MRLSKNFHEIELAFQKEVIKLLRKETDPPEKHTIFGTDINEIRHIFYYLKSNKIPVHINYLVDTYTGFILDVEDIFTRIQVLGFEETSFRRCRISFNFLNTYYQFEITIHKVEKDTVIVYTPLYLQYTAKRKFPRFYPGNLYAHVNLVFNYLFSYREYEQIFYRTFPKVVEEFKKDLPDIQVILRIIHEEIKKISDNYEIILHDSGNGFTEDRHFPWKLKQMKHLEKTIFIENTDILRSYYAPLNNPLVTNFERTYRTMLRSMSEEDVLRFFETIQKDDIRNQKFSYIIAPVTIMDHTFGYIYVENNYLERKRIFIDDAIKVHITGRILSYALNRVIIYKNFYETANFLVKNISLSGILLSTRSKEIYNFLIGNDLLKVILEVNNQTLQLTGIITRMFASEDTYNIALEFVEYEEHSFKYLEEYIFQLQKQEIKKGAQAPIATEFRE